MMPGNEYPYTVRVVFRHSGEQWLFFYGYRMCRFTALMDAGVPFPKHVGGVAMGLIARASDNKWAVLTDILRRRRSPRRYGL